MTVGTLILAKVTINADQLSNSIIRLRVQLCSIEEEFDWHNISVSSIMERSIWFDYRTFDWLRRPATPVYSIVKYVFQYVYTKITIHRSVGELTPPCYAAR